MMSTRAVLTYLSDHRLYRLLNVGNDNVFQVRFTNDCYITIILVKYGLTTYANYYSGDYNDRDYRGAWGFLRCCF